MRKKLIEDAAMEVATQVRSVEDLIEATLSELAELQSRMVRARAVSGISTATGHKAFEHLASATTALVAARGGVAFCHGALRETKQFVPGLRTTNFGPDECPPQEAVAPLRIVA